VRNLRSGQQVTPGHDVHMTDPDWRQKTIGRGMSLFDWQ
jgi:hypothetical protein